MEKAIVYTYSISDEQADVFSLHNLASLLHQMSSLPKKNVNNLSFYIGQISSPQMRFTSLLKLQKYIS